MKNDSLGKDSNTVVDDLKMQEIANHLQSVLPNHGFALIAFEIEGGSSHGKYISNVTDEFMIRALEFQVQTLKAKIHSSSQLQNPELEG